MSSIRINSEHKTILDFGSGKISKKEALTKIKSADFLEFKNSNGVRTYMSYDIKIGIYTIFIHSFHTQVCAKKFKEYNKVDIIIHEGNNYLNINQDNRFSSERWIKANKKQCVKPSHLADAIAFCSRLNNIKAFL